MVPCGVLWHSTAANNPTLKRYVQPSDVKPVEDTYTKEEWLEKLGVNKYKNDWNHTEVQAGLSCWIGKLADGTITTIQTMPWDFRPWGCGSGKNGSCNDGWVQFEICEDNLENEDYFNAVYMEACELTAYICMLYSVDPKGTVELNGVEVPTILCHADSYKLGLGSNHGDVYHWFKKYNKTMDDVRNDVAKLLQEAAVVKTYELITAVPTYSSAGDAKAKANAKGTYNPGVYYVYNKYPDGINGMLNISKDKTGNSAGGWINPSENVITEVKEEVEKLYRVRLAWEDTKSQKGAYSDLSNAKKCCNEAGDGYKVFDCNGNEVYAYVAPEQPKEPEKPVAVYDLDFPEKTKIVDKTINRADVDCAKAIKKIRSNNADFDIEIAKAFFRLAPRYGIDPMMAISQSILETGWFKYKGSAVTADQHNYCGLAVVSTGVKGAAFDTIEDGVTAQLQHLFAYGCKEALPENEAILDPRFSLVIRGVAQYWQQLAGRWACPGYDTTKYATPAEAMVAGNTYGQKIYTIYEQLCAVEVSEEEIQQYFPTVKDEPVVDEPVIDETTPEANSTDNKVAAFTMLFEAIKKLIIAIINIFTKKN
jgi:flagellum-specific peptidoglycan hydrolase FlgJ